jgi:drug/metabolite transporter (DMT)-like permease
MVELPAPLPPASAAAVRGQTYLLLAFIVLAWGSNYPLMKLAIADMPPLAFTAVRLFGAAAVLGIILAWKRQPLLPVAGERRPLAIAGLFQIAGMLGLTIIGLTTVSPGRAGLLVYTMQLWAVPLSMLILREKPGARMLVGSAIGLAGILVFFIPSSIDWHDPATLPGYTLILLAAIAWALGSCLYRRHAWQSSFMAQTLWQIGVSALAISALSLAFEHDGTFHLTARLGAIVVFNWFVPTALGLWCWSKVLSVMPVSTAGQWLLLTPLVGLMLSVVFMNEPVTLALVTSTVLITGGILLTVQGEAVKSLQQHGPDRRK